MDKYVVKLGCDDEAEFRPRQTFPLSGGQYADHSSDQSGTSPDQSGIGPVRDWTSLGLDTALTLPRTDRYPMSSDVVADGLSRTENQSFNIYHYV